jgi:hypothetical protein
MIDERSRRRVVIAMSIGVVLMLAYWIAWYASRSLVASDTTKSYTDFENAFPAGDAWITACLVGAIVTLRRRSPLSLFWLLAGGGAGVYLFCIDALYDVEHGVWFKNGGGAIELGINVVTLAVSTWLLRWAWRNRSELLADR